MIRAVNLMPESCRLALGRRERIRRWTIIYTGVVVVLGAGAWLLFQGQGARIERREALARQLRQAWDRNEEAQRLLTRSRELNDAIDRYTRLAWPVRVSDVIDTLAAELPEGVSLTSLSMTPREEGRRGRPSGGSKSAENSEKKPESRSFLVVELEGVSPSDSEVAGYVSALDQHPLFESVAMDYARSSKVRSTEARAFRVTATINLSHEYAFVDAAGAPPIADAPALEVRP
jgi:Tfp pilus assembly protein PilN